MTMRRLTLVFFLCTGWLTLVAQSDPVSAQLDSAWAAWQRNDRPAVEAAFQAVLEQDSSNVRALAGLGLLYDQEYRFDNAWPLFERLFVGADNPYPWLFALWSSATLVRIDRDSSGIVDLWRRISADSAADGQLRAMANQDLGQYFELRGQPDSSAHYYARSGALRDWRVIGPFDNISASGFERVFPPETEFKPDKRYAGKNGVPARWFPLEAIRADGWIDFRRYFAFDEAVFYGNTFVYSEREQAVEIRVGTSGSLKTFLNDQEIQAVFDENNNDLDTYIVRTRLRKGWNRLLIKCGFSEITQCNYMVRLTDEEGDPIRGLRVSSEPQRYSDDDAAPAEARPNFAEQWFRERIAANPDHLELYVLLAQCYLRNDKAVEGELILRAALERAPDTGLFIHHQIEAFNRGEKFDEIVTALERLHVLDPTLPEVLQYKIEQYLENGQVARSEPLLDSIRAILPDTPERYQLELAYYSSKRDVQAIIATSSAAYAAFPDNWQIAATEASISIQTSRSYGRAVEIYEDFLSRSYTVAALAALADAYLEASAVEQWEATHSRILELDPSATGYYFAQANTYYSLQAYARAAAVMERGIAICPNSSQYWSKLGEIRQAAGEDDGAREAFREALLYNPANYGAREKLRELEGRPDIFAAFDTIDVAARIAAAPGAADYPDDGAVILLNDINRVVYEGGASEVREELLVRVLNNRGLDDFKEYWIGYNGHTENLIVEQARVVKGDGSEIAADVNQNHVVFKSVEEGDVLHLKWRIKNLYSGKLSDHFWDSAYFSGFYPMVDVRYALLVPKGFDFNYRAQNMDIEPTRRSTADGVVYEWRLRDQPAMDYEVGMPLVSDIGKMLFLSSIPDWGYMVDWYRDLAATKTRATFEIREEVRRLFEGRDGLSDREKIETIYTFITENIRYSSVSFRQSGLIPQKARDVLVSRIGDCKDVATLCIAMLREVGIEAHYVLVNTRDEGYNPNVLPSISFNHCIAGVETGDGIQYLDLTANNYPYGSVPDMDEGAFALLIRSGVEETTYLDTDRFLPRNLVRSMAVTIHPDNGISAEKSGYRTGSLAAVMRGQYRDQSPRAREKALLEVLAQDHPDVKLLAFEIENLEAINEPLRYRYDYLAPDHVSEVGRFKFLKIPWTDHLTTDKALSYERRDYPYYYWPRADTLAETVEIHLPPGFEPVELGEDVRLECPIAEYTLTFRYENGVITGRRELINKAAIVQPEDYAAFRGFYNTVVKQDARQLLLRTVEVNP